METSEPKNLAEPAVKSSNSAKKWLWLLPVLGICTLSFCVIAGGMIFWQTRSQQADESSPITDLSLQNQAEDGFATTPPALTPTLPQTVEATAFTCPVDEEAASPAITAPLLSSISFALTGAPMAGRWIPRSNLPPLSPKYWPLLATPGWQMD